MEEILSFLGTDDNPVDSSLMVLNFPRKRNDAGSFVYAKNGMALVVMEEYDPVSSIRYETTSRWVSSTYPPYSLSPLSVHA
ncbi:hypothetical protein NPIL_396641 [Nephila pilipes]|uniref:Uncharacterized protein n=1 Tax=Nephila pilipes TaxID=299642 RepID=A0A8X6N0I8_NEPPI|nr:hypothetical protein NPIL_396641 [Nephila pilipes]